LAARALAKIESGLGRSVAGATAREIAARAQSRRWRYSWEERRTQRCIRERARFRNPRRTTSHRWHRRRCARLMQPVWVSAVAAVVKLDCPITLVAFGPSLRLDVLNTSTRLLPWSLTNNRLFTES